MGRIGTFIFGLAFGAALIFAAQRYHLLRADDGFYLIPKTRVTLQDAYVDIRQFRLDDWTRHPALTAAIFNAKKERLLGAAAAGTLRDKLRGMLQRLTGG